VIDRRTTVKWVLAAGAAWPLLGRGDGGVARADTAPTAHGYGTDPKLVADYKLGELWPLTLTAAQRRLAGILADIIIPADEQSPSATAVGVVEFIDEWVSAPYPAQQRDRTRVLEGFAWLDAEAARRSGKGFSDLAASEQRGICDDICDTARATPARAAAARFFALYRDLTSGAFYSTPAGRKDLKFIGNVRLARFDGPPPELLKALGLE
jgi:gluconate 2-dehydrogenase subunit 3-like protein